MMYPRLRLSRNLLKDDGFIFISIDNHEIANLIKICNEIFGTENLISCIANVNNPKGRSDDKYIATAHEYLLIYRKSSKAKLGGFDPTEVVTRRYRKVDNTGRKYREIDLRKTGDADRRLDRPNMFYPFFYNETTKDFFPGETEENFEGYIKIIPKKADGSDGRWRWEKNTSKQKLDKIYPKFMPNRNIWGVFEKDFLDEKKSILPTSSWAFKDVNSERGTESFINLGFDKEHFSRPKPIGLIKRILKISVKKDDIVLDFFSGSASTAHALFETNCQEKMLLKFILIQLPEQLNKETGFINLCEVGKERIRRSGDLIKLELQEKYEKQQISQMTMLDDSQQNMMNPNDLDIGFKVFKLDSSNLKKWNPEFDNLENNLLDMVENFVDERTEEDVLYEIMLKYGIDLTYSVESEVVNGKTVFNIGFGMLFICMSKGIDMSVAEYIIQKRDELIEKTEVNEKRRKNVRVVFLDNGFMSDDIKTNVKMKLELAGFHEIVSV